VISRDLGLAAIIEIEHTVYQIQVYIHIPQGENYASIKQARNMCPIKRKIRRVQKWRRGEAHWKDLN
jgi:hypothetical protein